MTEAAPEAQIESPILPGEGTPTLSQYAADVERITGESVINEPETPPESEDTPPEEPQPEAKKPSKPRLRPTQRPIEEVLKDPRVQAEVDRRAAALERSKREQYQQEIAAKDREEAAHKAQKEYTDLVRAAAGEEYADETIDARRRLAELESTRIMRENMAVELRPAIAAEIGGQIHAGYAKIPEFQYQEVWDALHDSKYDDAGTWFVTNVDTISALRVAAKEQELTAKHAKEIESRAKELAEGLSTSKLADYRSTLHNPETAPIVSPNENSRRYKNRLELARDVDRLLASGMTTADIRQMRKSLPEAEIA